MAYKTTYTIQSKSFISPQDWVMSLAAISGCNAIIARALKAWLAIQASRVVANTILGASLAGVRVRLQLRSIVVALTRAE